MAEREGFEPSIEFPLYTLSKRAPSTTRPSLRRDAVISLTHAEQIIPEAQVPFGIVRRRGIAPSGELQKLFFRRLAGQRQILLRVAKAKACDGNTRSRTGSSPAQKALHYGGRRGG